MSSLFSWGEQSVLYFQPHGGALEISKVPLDFELSGRRFSLYPEGYMDVESLSAGVLPNCIDESAYDAGRGKLMYSIVPLEAAETDFSVSIDSHGGRYAVPSRDYERVMRVFLKDSGDPPVGFEASVTDRWVLHVGNHIEIPIG